MRERALHYLICPDCGSGFTLRVDVARGDQVETGGLCCRGCHRIVPIRGGVPRFVSGSGPAARVGSQSLAVRGGHGASLAAAQDEQRLDQLVVEATGDPSGAAVLDGGCGEGARAALIAALGARDVVAVDTGLMADAAYENTHHLDNVHVIEAAVGAAPVQPIFDCVISAGMLHRSPDAASEFRALAGRLRHGGSLCAWVYMSDGQGRLARLAAWLRAKLWGRVPDAVLASIAAVLALPLSVLYRFVYRPGDGRLFGMMLPAASDMAVHGRVAWHDQRHVIFEYLTTPAARYPSRADFEAWFDLAGLTEARFRSWGTTIRVGVANRPVPRSDHATHRGVPARPLDRPVWPRPAPVAGSDPVRRHG